MEKAAKNFGTFELANEYAGKNSFAGYADHTIMLSKEQMAQLQAGCYLAFPGHEYGLVIGYEPNQGGE